MKITVILLNNPTEPWKEIQGRIETLKTTAKLRSA